MSQTGATEALFDEEDAIMWMRGEILPVWMRVGNVCVQNLLVGFEWEKATLHKFPAVACVQLVAGSSQTLQLGAAVIMAIAIEHPKVGTLRLTLFKQLCNMQQAASGCI